MDDSGTGGSEVRPSSSDPSHSGADGLLADQLSDLARLLESEGDVESTLDAIVHAAVETVPGAEHASISAIQRRQRVNTRAATGQLSHAVDRAQYDAGEGPCLDSLYKQKTVRVMDMVTEQRWPEFTKRAAEVGVGSMLSVQLYVDGDDLGALNLVSEQPNGFDDDSEHIALLFASHAAVAMAGVQKQQQLLSAMDTRDLIGQAKGILMERFKITGDQAFTLLVRGSQHTNRRLVEIAETLVTSGDLPRASGNSQQEDPGLPGPARR